MCNILQSGNKKLDNAKLDFVWRYTFFDKSYPHCYFYSGNFYLVYYYYRLLMSITPLYNIFSDRVKSGWLFIICPFGSYVFSKALECNLDPLCNFTNFPTQVLYMDVL